MIKNRRCVACETEKPELAFRGGTICMECELPAQEAEIEEHVSKEDDAKERAKKEIAARFLSRKRFLPFVERVNPEYEAGWVHRDICKRLEKFSQDVIDKKGPRLILQVPPRHGKSTLASIAFPAWHLGNHPSHEFISVAYSASLSMGFSRKVRDMLRDPSYKNVFKTRLDAQSQSAEAWLTSEGGGFVAAGVGGGITGRGAHVLVIDDPVKNREEAESQYNRESTWDWYTSTAYTRLAPGGGVLVIMTRWHDDDLAGRLLTQAEEGGDQWELISYPAIAEEDEEYRNAGDALHPARYDIDALKRINKAVGPRDWAALYQQQPVGEEGDYFKRDQIKYYNLSETDLGRMVFYQAWDLAIGKGDRNDFTVGITVGVDEFDNLYVVDIMRGKYDGFQIVENVLDFADQWAPRAVGIEKGHLSMAIGPFLEKRVRERKAFQHYIQDLSVGRRDKELRARAIQGRIQQGMVLFPRDADFTADLVGEMLRFPMGVHDDQVDALAWVGLMLAEMDTYHALAVPEPASWRDKLDSLMRPERRDKSEMSA